MSTPDPAGSQDFTEDNGYGNNAMPANGVPYWAESADAWNTLIIAGRRFPGIVKVGGKAFEVRADKKKKAGTSGEKLTKLGREVAEPEFTIQLWTKEHLDQYVEIVRLFTPRGSGQLPPPVTVIHPALAIYGVKSVQIMVASFPEMKDSGGLYEVKLKTREFVQARPGKVKTDDATGSEFVKEFGEHQAVPKAIAASRARVSPEAGNGNEPRGKTP